MEPLTLSLLLAFISLTAIKNIAVVAIGLGMVIFFHELGHFAVAKWCDVKVERFSIGFGPILLKWKWGETEYALSVVPFGGYVKMLGQDDADPGQMADEDVAEDPRSYTAKSVPSRMAIISAGVIMNLITGLIFFAIAFRMGVNSSPPVFGHVFVGDPAWQAGLQTGDKVTAINGTKVNEFIEIVQATVLSWKDELVFDGVHPDGTTFTKTVIPELKETRRMIGVLPSQDLIVPQVPDPKLPFVVQGSPASKAKPAFEMGDRIVRIDDQDVNSFFELKDTLARVEGDEFKVTVKRGEGSNAAEETLTLKSRRFRTLGLWLDIGQVASLQKGSPAEKAGIKVGDKIIRIEDQIIGQDINCLRLPDYFAALHGQNVKVTVTREADGEAPKELDFDITPVDRPGWTEVPIAPNQPLSVPSIGVAFHLNRLVMKVDEEGPVKGDVEPGELIDKIELFLPEGVATDHYGNETISLSLDAKNRNLAYAFCVMQRTPLRHVRLTIKDKDEEQRTVAIKPAAVDNWYWPEMGLVLSSLNDVQQAIHFGDAVAMGYARTRSSAVSIYMTLQNLFLGRLSVKELHGPLGIASAAYTFAERGLADFLVFLGLLSINLAVLNFLPIPVLDGGHMVFLIWEGITRRKPSEKVLIAATYIGLAFVLSLMLFVIYLDVFRHDVFGIGN